MATEKAERGRQSHAGACRKHLARIGADRRRRPQGREATMSSGFGEGVFLDFRTDRKNITDGLPVWPVEAYFIRRWPSFGDVLVAYQEDLEPLALDAATVKDNSVDRKALGMARRDLVGKVLSALGRSERNYPVAEQALGQWRREHMPDEMSDADAYTSPDACTRVAGEASILRNILCYFRDPRGFMEEMALDGTHALEGVVWTWGPAAFLNTTLWAAVVKSSPLGIHQIMARVNSAGPAKLMHAVKGSKHDLSTSLRKQKTERRLKALRATELLLHDPSSPDAQAARKELRDQGMRVLLAEIDKREHRLDKRPAEREAKTLLAEFGNEDIKRATITRTVHRTRS